MPVIWNRTAAVPPSGMWPAATSNASGASSRSTESVISSTSMPSPAASCRIVVPQAIPSTPGWYSIGISSACLPNPITSNITVAPS
jgi:hypothetical protein